MDGRWTPRGDLKLVTGRRRASEFRLYPEDHGSIPRKTAAESNGGREVL